MSRRWLRWALLAFGFAGVLGCALFLIKANERSFAVEAVTRGLRVEVEHTAMSSWLLDAAVVCFRRERRLGGGASAAGSAHCDPALYETVALANLELAWPSGAVVALNRSGPDSPLVVRLETAAAAPVDIEGRPLTPTDRVVVESADWLGNSTLTIAGRIVVGARPGPGETGNLLTGSYAVSERLPLAPTPVQLLDGTLLSGDTAEIVTRTVDGFRPAQAFGFVEPRGAREAGMGVTFYSEAGDNGLAIGRFGANGLTVTPHWVHRALANPVLLGGSALLAVFSGLASLSFLGPVLAWANRRGGGAARPAADPVEAPASVPAAELVAVAAVPGAGAVSSPPSSGAPSPAP